jgi:hypothetical protein
MIDPLDEELNGAAYRQPLRPRQRVNCTSHLPPEEDIEIFCGALGDTAPDYGIPDLQSEVPREHGSDRPEPVERHADQHPEDGTKAR